MQVLDYGGSFVTFVTRGRGNNARLQVESVCTLTDPAGRATDFLFFASCKSEHTYAERGLFHADNYDFCGIFSTEEYVIFRTPATHSEGYREEGAWCDRFEDVQQHLVRRQGRVLETSEQIVRATLAGGELVGVVELAAGASGLSARLEFPIKTMNVNDLRMIWQVDTGPVPFPDLERSAGRLIQRLSPAYVAYNAPTFADFVVQQPVAVAGGAATVTHYSGPQALAARTAVIALSRTSTGGPP
ncbi:MAG: hypothetical protein AB1505_28195 [Candidatus Latescibacterota bacterium]